MRTFFAFVLIFVFGASPALARTHHYRHHVHHNVYRVVQPKTVHPDFTKAFLGVDANNPAPVAPVGVMVRQQRVATAVAASSPRHGGEVVGRDTSLGCPGRLGCGCVASVHTFGHPVRGLYLAANWGKFPPASPAPGMAAWRWGHVFVLERQAENGNWIVYDGNQHGVTIIHERSLSGYHVVNPHA